MATLSGVRPLMDIKGAEISPNRLPWFLLNLNLHILYRVLTKETFLITSKGIVCRLILDLV